MCNFARNARNREGLQHAMKAIYNIDHTGKVAYFYRFSVKNPEDNKYHNGILTPRQVCKYANTENIITLAHILKFSTCIYDTNIQNSYKYLEKSNLDEGNLEGRKRGLDTQLAQYLCKEPTKKKILKLMSEKEKKKEETFLYEIKLYGINTTYYTNNIYLFKYDYDTINGHCGINLYITDDDISVDRYKIIS